MKSNRFILLFLLVFFVQSLFAGEGMWLPFLLKSMNEKDMQSMGMKMSAEDIYSVNKGSLKDAIIHFNGGCTGSIISSQGLILTNHHCGFSFIQSHSSLEHNYIDEGFWAMSGADELSNKNLVVTMIRRMEDVTQMVLAGVADDLPPAERQSAIDKNILALKGSLQLQPFEEATVKPFFYGNQFILIVTVDFQDVRMVGAPPNSIGAFGADTDNWVWPRHSGDFSLFRIYADKDNNPAKYSPDNVPYKPAKYLSVSMDGVAEGDFTLVFGFPGRTSEYLPSYAVSQIADVLDPARIQIRDIALKIIGEKMRQDPATKIKYASKYARIANYWKKWQGEVLGINKSNAVAQKQAVENIFQKRVSENKNFAAKYGNLLPQFEQLYREIEPYALAREYYAEICLRNTELFSLANSVDSWLNIFRNNGEEAYLKQATARMDRFEGIFADLDLALDQKVFAALMEKYVKDVPAEFHPAALQEELKICNGNFEIMAHRVYNYSLLADLQKFRGLMAAPPKDVEQILQEDMAFKLFQGFAQVYKEQIAPSYNKFNDQIEDLLRTYMKAQMEVLPEKTYYPDANSTLRVTYGKVEGYEPKDAVRYHYLTHAEGIMEKYVPSDYEFDVAAKLQKLVEDKDFGRYGVNGKLPVCFLGSNHTTGGNSGSPVLDASGNLIGLNFDRVWEGTMSDIHYDLSLCRNIMVDMRYILFIIDKFAGAPHLVEELNLVHPKKKK